MEKRNMRKSVRERVQELGNKRTISSGFQYSMVAGLAVLCFIVYSLTLYSGALPNAPAQSLCYVTGAMPDFFSRHWVWKWIMRGWLSMFGNAHTVFAANVFCALISALGVGVFYLVCSSVFALFFRDEGFSAIVGAETTPQERTASVFGGLTAAVTLAFSAPYWNMATQVYVDSFYLLWLLISIYVFLTYVMTQNVRLLYLFCFIHCAGMSQTSSFIAFAPFLFLGAGTVLYLSEKMNARTVLVCALACALGFSFLFFSTWAYYGSEGYILGGTESYSDLFFNVVRSLLNGVTGQMPRVGWMIIVGTTVVPCVVVLISGIRSLNQYNDWSTYGVNLAVFAATLAVVLDLRISPWSFFGLGAPHIVPYAMMAMAFGYSLMYLYVLSFHWFVYEEGKFNAGVIIRTAAFAAAASLCLFAFVNNYKEADNKRLGFVGKYVDRLLDGLGGRKWVATNGVFDGSILLRAAERGIYLNTINMSRPMNRVEINRIKEKLGDNVRLRNAADVGIMSLVQEWICGDHDAAGTLALSLLPDLWNLGDYESYPDGLLFCGIRSADFGKLADRDLVSPYMKTLEEIDAALPDEGEDVVGRFESWYAELVRRHVSFIGNNLGFYLEQTGRKEEAFNVYLRVHDFDTKNISALLNFASLVQSGMHPEMKDRVMSDLKQFQERVKSPVNIWSLSRDFGYVSDPELFARMGWTWAMTGQSKLAIRSLDRALESAGAESRGMLQTAMAELYAEQENTSQSEALYREVLKGDPSNHKALMGLVTIYLTSRQFDMAEEYLKMASKAGVPSQKVDFERALICFMKGETDEAMTLANELLKNDPNNTDVHLFLVEIYARAYNNAADEMSAKSAIEGVRKSVDELSRITGPESLQTRLTRGTYNKLLHNYREARKDFLGAVASAPNKAKVLEMALEMDYSLVDKSGAMDRARRILHLDPENAYANYIMGSLALDDERFQEAEDFLARSVKRRESVFALNDLSVAKMYLNKLDEAESLVRRVIEKDKNIYVTWDTLGCIYLKKGKYDEAEEALKTAVRLYDKDLRVYLHIAQVLFYQERYDECRDTMRRLSAGVDSFAGRDREDYESLSQALLSVGK